MPDSPARTYAEQLASATPLAAAALAFATSIEPGDRNTEINGLAARADLDLTHARRDFEPHLADPMAQITLCSQDIERRLTGEQKGRISVLCATCETAGHAIAAAREAKAARDKEPVTAPRVHRFDSTVEAYDETQCNDEIRDGDVLVIASEKVVGFLNNAWPVALTVRHGELHTLNVPVADVNDGKYTASARLAAGQARELDIALRDDHAPEAEPTARQVDDMMQAANEAGSQVAADPDPQNPHWQAALARLTAANEFLRKHHAAYGAAVNASEEISAPAQEGEHHNTPRGCAPKHCGNPDVSAALDALDGLAYATLTDRHDISEPQGSEHEQRGYAVEPRGAGWVAVYWLEQGRMIRRDDPVHGPAIDCLAQRLNERGWSTQELLPSAQCVFAQRSAPTPPRAANHWALALQPQPGSDGF